MRRLVHRRRIRPSDDEPRGPGGTIGPILAPLSWLGWLSIVATVGHVWIEMAERQVVSGDVINWVEVFDVLALGCVVLAPAALELGYPGVRRRNRALLAGLVLLAFVEVSRPLGSWLYHWGTDVVAQSQGMTSGDPSEFDPDAALTFAYGLMGAARQVIGLAGWLSLVSGLAAAGARPRRALLVATTIVLVAPTALSGIAELWATATAPDLALTTLPLPILVVGSVVGVGAGAARAAVLVALLVGVNLGLRPRLAWRLGGAAAAALVAVLAIDLAFSLVVWQVAEQASDFTLPLLTATTVLDIGYRVLLLAACFAGLGRGTEERHVPPWRVFWVWGERRFRPAA